MRIGQGLLPLLLLTSACVHGAPLEVIADEWCPINCQPNAPMPGYAVEVLQAVFADDGINYRVRPWKRALLQTRMGTSTAAIAATQAMAQADNLKIGQEPVGYSVDCLYVLAGNPVHFHGHPDELNSLKRVGIALGYEYDGGFGTWLRREANKAKVFVASGDHPAAYNLAKLTKGGLDGMIEEQMVMSYMLRNATPAEPVVSAGCNPTLPLYMAFSPNHPDSDALVRQFDQGLVALRNSGQLAKILAKYGLKDWR